MSRKFKSQASSARAASTLTGGFGFGSTFQTSTSPLAYVTEQPDLSLITQPNVVVAFKNLGKKDSVTKAKAIEELQENCTAEVEQGVLQAWADIYPRTSIDNSRRVRQLAHTLQGNLTFSAGKRIAPFLPKVISPWLAGTFDSDKSVAKSAQDALQRSFTTPEKRRALWTLYKDALIEYLEDAITVQSVTSLSDERTTSADDAQAKYVRVVGTAVNVLAQLLKDGVQSEQVAMLIGGKKLWEFVYHEDSYLRRSLSDLVTIASEKYFDHLDWTVISTCFLSKALNSSQVGSSRQYTAALLILTQRRPELWTTDYIAKTSISRRLAQFLRQGSQNGPEDVWSNMAALIRVIPEQAWSTEKTFESATSLVEALRTGVTLPTERVNAAAAWATYVQTCLWLIGKMADRQADFAGQQLVPIVKQYVTKKVDQQWSITVRAVQICKGILVGLIKVGIMPVLESIWSELTASIIDEMRLSLPETSKEFRSSQDAVIDQAKRLFTIKAEVQKAPESSQMAAILKEGDSIMLDAAIQLLRTRNGKPYGAAAVVDFIVSQSQFERSNRSLQTFLEQDLTPLLDSPSSERLASIALTCGQTSFITSSLTHRSVNRDRALCSALIRIEPAALDEKTEHHLSSLDLTKEPDRQILVSIMQNHSLTALHAQISTQLQNHTSATASTESQQDALTLLKEISFNSQALQVIASDTCRAPILSNLLVLADTRTEFVESANMIISKLNSSSRSGAGSTSIIQQQLNGEGTPLSIFTLIDLANGVVQTEEPHLGAIMPTSEAWDKALRPHLSSPRPYSLTVTSPLQGVLYTLNASSTQDGDRNIRDQDDFSHAFRLCLYVTKILTSDFASKFKEENLRNLYLSYPTALHLVNEKLTVEDANEIWTQTTPEVLQEAVDVLSEGNKLIQSWLTNEEFVSSWIKILYELKDNSIATYITASAWVNVVAQLMDQNGPTQLLQEYDEQLRRVHRSENVVQSAALLAALWEYVADLPHGKRILNEFVVDATELSDGRVMKTLILVNVLLHGVSDSLDVIPERKLVVMISNLLRLLQDPSAPGMQSEIIKFMTMVVPHVKDSYGDHWEQLFAALLNIWCGEADLPTLNTSLRLYARLRILLGSEDVNEDLQDSWKSARSDLDAGLLDCLHQLDQKSQYTDQPRNITAELVRRQLRDVDLKMDENMYDLLSSSVDAVQNAAFDLLHRAIPQRQEELSVELLLEKRNVQLSRDLVVLLEDDQSNPRRYLLAWKLVFDHFMKASYKLQEAYTADLKEAGHIDALLDSVCGFLRIVSGRPVDASKFDVANFSIDEAESMEKEIQWLAIHNYYNALFCVPSLAKEWFISQKNRVKSPLETWTQKHISPMIVAASMSTVTEWASAQAQDEDDRPFTIKSSPRGSEITAAIAVDPESPPISLAISLPASYPLESPVVTSRTRVGVSEKNWQSWLRTIQIIIFSTGSIIEGLIAFRRNVHGALKGQSECAICYSIIGTDMQTPNKRCGTCKNNFHGTCLFRWFKSSNSSSCPLCRNNFNYA